MFLCVRVCVYVCVCVVVCVFIKLHITVQSGVIEIRSFTGLMLTCHGLDGAGDVSLECG